MRIFFLVTVLRASNDDVFVVYGNFLHDLRLYLKFPFLTEARFLQPWFLVDQINHFVVSFGIWHKFHEEHPIIEILKRLN